MRWSAKLGRFAGIDVYVHVTFLLLLAWIGWIYWTDTGTLAGVVQGITLILLLFLCVLLHEYGHALTARRFGIGTQHITLLPIGGVALLQGMPRDPRQEIVVALAGPAVNIAIAAVLWLLLLVLGSGSRFSLDIVRSSLLQTLLFANLALALFNLLPAFPMDGGRVLRALLALRLDRVRATQVAAIVGRILAVGLAILGVMGNPFLVLIAAFVWMGAGSEAAAVAASDRLQNEPVEAAMRRDFTTLAPTDTLGRAVDLSLSGWQKDFPLATGGRIAGIATEAAILRGLRELGPDRPVSEVARPAATAPVGTPLFRLLAALRRSETRVVLVVDGERLVGLIEVGRMLDEIERRQAG